MTKLTYTSFAALEADFKAGAKFVVVDKWYPESSPRNRREVMAIELLNSNKARVRVQGSVGYGAFNPDGTNRVGAEFQLLKVADAPVPVALAKTFIEQFIGGSEFHTPHTRETVVDVKFVRGHNCMDVTLRDEAGKERVTPRYNLDGTHKFRPERNLVAGKLPPKMIERKVTIYRHAYNGSLFVIREGEVIPSIRGISNATKVGETTITEQQ